MTVNQLKLLEEVEPNRLIRWLLKKYFAWRMNGVVTQHSRAVTETKTSLVAVPVVLVDEALLVSKQLGNRTNGSCPTEAQ